MKNFLTFLLAFFFISCNKEEVYVEPMGLLQGLSFEQSNTFDLDYYKPEGTSYDIEWTEKEAFDGKYSLKISSATNQNHQSALWYYSFYEVKPGEPLNVRVRVKSNVVSGKGVKISLYIGTDLYSYLPEDYYEEDSEMLATGTGDEWKTLELSTSGNLPEAVVYVDIYMELMEETLGTVYFDKLELFTGL